MNKTILLAASFMLALVFTVSCSSDDGDGGGTSAKEYCKVGSIGPVTCLEMPKSECSADFYKNNGYDGPGGVWKTTKYEVVNECAKLTVACLIENYCQLPPGDKDYCEGERGGKAFKTIKECEDYKKSTASL